MPLHKFLQRDTQIPCRYKPIDFTTESEGLRELAVIGLLASIAGKKRKDFICTVMEAYNRWSGLQGQFSYELL